MESTKEEENPYRFHSRNTVPTFPKSTTIQTEFKSKTKNEECKPSKLNVKMQFPTETAKYDWKPSSSSSSSSSQVRCVLHYTGRHLSTEKLHSDDRNKVEYLGGPKLIKEIVSLDAQPKTKFTKSEYNYLNNKKIPYASLKFSFPHPTIDPISVAGQYPRLRPEEIMAARRKNAKDRRTTVSTQPRFEASQISAEIEEENSELSDTEEEEVFDDVPLITPFNPPSLIRTASVDLLKHLDNKVKQEIGHVPSNKDLNQPLFIKTDSNDLLPPSVTTIKGKKGYPSGYKQIGSLHLQSSGSEGLVQTSDTEFEEVKVPAPSNTLFRPPPLKRTESVDLALRHTAAIHSHSENFKD